VRRPEGTAHKSVGGGRRGRTSPAELTAVDDYFRTDAEYDAAAVDSQEDAWGV